MLKRKSENEFFIIIDMPLYETQCQMLFDHLDNVLPDVVEDVTHDGYGSFIVEVAENFELTDDLMDDLFDHSQEICVIIGNAQHIWMEEMDPEEIADDLNYYMDTWIAENEDAGYSWTWDQLIDDFQWIVEKTLVEKAVMLKKLAGVEEAA